MLRVNSDLLALTGLDSPLDNELKCLSYVNAAWSGITPLSHPKPFLPVHRRSNNDHSASWSISAESVIVQTQAASCDLSS